MSSLRFGRLAIRPVVVGLLVLAASVAQAKQPEVPPPHRHLHVTFSQLDWHAVDGVTVAFDTLWGAVDYEHAQVRGQTRFLNVFASSAEGTGAWVIQNLPLFAEKGPARPSVTGRAFFDLSELGIAEGQPLVSLCYAATVDTALRLAPPGPASTCVAVESLDYEPGDSPNFALPGPLEPGAPFPMKFSDEPNKLGGKRKEPFNEVQEGHKQCMAGAIARSLDWLNRERKLGSEKTAQEFYTDLVAAGVTLDGPGGAAKAEGDRVANKKRYTDDEFNGRVVTKTWDPARNINTPKGTKESHEDFATWLKREWETEDVEVAFKGPDFAHIFTVTEVAEEKNGNFKIKYRDDEKQGVDKGDKRGDMKEKDGEIFKKDGKWYFNNTNFPLDLGISESVKKKKSSQISSTTTSSTTSTVSAPTTTTTSVTTTTSLSSPTTTLPVTTTAPPASTTLPPPTTSTSMPAPPTTQPSFTSSHSQPHANPHPVHPVHPIHPLNKEKDSGSKR